MRRSPFLPFLLFWAVLAAVGFWASWRFLPPMSDLWRVLAALNAATFLLYGADKMAAMAGGQRAPERLLFLTAFLGSPLGGLAGMFVFRHNVSKMSFLFAFAVILLAQVALAAWWFGER